MGSFKGPILLYIMSDQNTYRILAVCLGNICRSPIAHGLLEHHSKNYDGEFIIDSAGTIGMHAGSPPDVRSIEIMDKHSHDITLQRSRQFRHYDFSEYDIILAMDSSNYRDLQSMAINDEEASRIRMMIEDTNVPDPYYGGKDGFKHVYDMLEKAVIELLDEVAGKH